MSDFRRTQMGHRFYQVTMPELVEQLTRLNALVERALAKWMDQDPREPSEGDRATKQR